MKKEIKKLWIDALRSGEYSQGYGKLRQVVSGKTKFCCLGVLCNLHAQAHPEIAAKETDATTYLGQVAYPDTAVFKWAGISDKLVTINGCKSDIGTYLWRLNDGAGYHRHNADFSDIADFIEVHL